MSGLQLLMFGVLGQYISRSYMEGKHRPIYIAREKKVKKDARGGAEGVVVRSASKAQSGGTGREERGL